MTSFTPYRIRNRDVDDGLERHIWGKVEYTKAGAHIKVRGTDTEDLEAPILVGVTSFNLKEKANSEVMLLSSSSDTNLKMAAATIPRDKQRRWMEECGGVQHPTDGDFALDFNDKHAHVTKAKFAVGEKGQFEIKGEEGYVRVKKLIVDGELIANVRVRTPQVVTGTEKPPVFQSSQQAPISGEGATPTQLSLDLQPPSAQLDLFDVR